MFSFRSLGCADRFATAEDLRAFLSACPNCKFGLDWDGVAAPWDDDQLIRLGITPFRGRADGEANGLASVVSISSKAWLEALWWNINTIAVRTLYPNAQRPEADGIQVRQMLAKLAVSGHWFTVANKLIEHLQRDAKECPVLSRLMPTCELNEQFMVNIVNERLKTFPIVPQACPGFEEFVDLVRGRAFVATSGFEATHQNDPLRQRVAQKWGKDRIITADGSGLDRKDLKPGFKPWATGMERIGVRPGSQHPVVFVEDAIGNTISILDGHPGAFILYVAREPSYDAAWRAVEDKQREKNTNVISMARDAGRFIVMPGGDFRPLTQALAA